MADPRVMITENTQTRLKEIILAPENLDQT
jgi:hypothetical protein